MCIRRLSIFVLLLLAPSLAAAQRPEPSPPQVPANELVKRAIQKEVENVLGRQILEGKIRDGQTVVADYDPKRGQLTFTPKAEAA